MHNWTEIYRSENSLNAHLKKRLLEQHGLQPILLDEHLASIVGMGGVGLPCRVLVKPEEAEEAKRILVRMDGPTLVYSVDEPETCPSCGIDWEPGFQVCWSCEKELS